MAPPSPKTGRRGSEKPAGRVALESPYQRDHTASAEARMGKGIMPKSLPALLRWYSDGWDDEVPTALHKSEVWRDHGLHAEGGSKLGAPAHADPFRRYLENTPSETDIDGWFIRPMHAALSRLERRWPLTARALFAVAQSGYDWRGVAERGHWAEEMFEVYIAEALRMLWKEYSDVGLRLA